MCSGWWWWTVSVLVLLDPSSAFNTINHYTLLHRLQSLYSISGTVLLRFESYLTGRTQWLSTIRVQDMCMFSLVSHRAQFLALSCLFFSLHLSPLWNSFCLRPVFCQGHTTRPTSLLSSWSDICYCPDHADMHLWCENLDDTKQTETEWQDRGSLCELK